MIEREATLTANLERIPRETFRTEADWISIVNLAESVDSARIRVARVARRLTSCSRISLISRQALAGCFVIEHFANCIRSTFAGIPAFPVDASFIARTFIVTSASYG